MERLLNCDKSKEKLTTGQPVDKHPDSKPPDKNEIKEIVVMLKNNKVAEEYLIVAE